MSPILLAYCGNLGEAPDLLGPGPVCTDDRPLIEYLAPVTQRRVGSKKASWFTGEELIDFLDALQVRIPPEDDLHLADFSPSFRAYPRAGLLVHKGRVLKPAGRTEEAEAVEAELRALLASISGRAEAPEDSSDGGP